MGTAIHGHIYPDKARAGTVFQHHHPFRIRIQPAGCAGDRGVLAQEIFEPHSDFRLVGIQCIAGAVKHPLQFVKGKGSPACFVQYLHQATHMCAFFVRLQGHREIHRGNSVERTAVAISDLYGQLHPPHAYSWDGYLTQVFLVSNIRK